MPLPPALLRELLAASGWKDRPLAPGCFLNLGLTPACTRTAPGPCPPSSLGQSMGAPRGLASALWTLRAEPARIGGSWLPPPALPDPFCLSSWVTTRLGRSRLPSRLLSGRALLHRPFCPSCSRHLPGSLSPSLHTAGGERPSVARGSALPGQGSRVGAPGSGVTGRRSRARGLPAVVGTRPGTRRVWQGSPGACRGRAAGFDVGVSDTFGCVGAEFLRLPEPLRMVISILLLEMRG